MTWTEGNPEQHACGKRTKGQRVDVCHCGAAAACGCLCVPVYLGVRSQRGAVKAQNKLWGEKKSCTANEETKEREREHLFHLGLRGLELPWL